jgi:glycerol-3-phosphate dehydrogenase
MGAKARNVAVIGVGVVGAATALALARRGAAVALLEAEPEPGLGASGTNSGILHTGFDSKPGELETKLILRGAELRDPVLDALGIPVLRCGAVMRPAVPELERNARTNGVEVAVRDGALEVPGESVTDPVAYTLALVGAAVEHGAELREGFRVSGLRPENGGLVVEASGGEPLHCGAAVNCAGLRADEVARLAGDDSFSIYPRKGEFFVFEAPPPERILLPVPDERTKGVLVFPTVDGRVVAGPTAVDLEDKEDWSVRPEAFDEIAPKAVAMHPPLEGSEPVFAYAGLRPAGRGVNYLIERSRACPELINVAAIRSTGLTASLGIAEHAAGLVEAAGIPLGAEEPLRPGAEVGRSGPWWRRSAEHWRAAA